MLCTGGPFRSSTLVQLTGSDTSPQTIAQTGLDLSFVATSVELFGKPLEEKLLVMDAYWCMELSELLNKSSPCFMEL